MGRFWKQGVALVRVAAVVAGGLMVGCTGGRDRVGTQVSAAESQGGVVAEAVRVGVYDSRAVAVAYGRSKMHAKVVSGLVEEHKKAKAAGDTERAEELNKLGELQQMRLHLQAFSNAPVGEAMDAVKDGLSEVMAKRGVSVVTSKADATMSGVELVDVTYDVVLLFEPDAATLRIVADMKGKEALPIEEVAMMPVGK